MCSYYNENIFVSKKLQDTVKNGNNVTWNVGSTKSLRVTLSFEHYM